jgi:hypothetical protein
MTEIIRPKTPQNAKLSLKAYVQDVNSFHNIANLILDFIYLYVCKSNLKEKS